MSILQPLPDRVVFCDVPGEVSAYRADMLLRFSRRLSRGTSITGHRWDSSGILSQTRDALPLLREIRDYQRRAVPMVEIDPADRFRGLSPPCSLGGREPQNYDRAMALSTRQPAATRGVFQSLICIDVDPAAASRPGGLL